MAGRFNIKNLKRGISYLKRNGISESYYKVVERLSRDNDEKDYTLKVKENEISQDEAIKQRSTSFEKPYLISILVPAYETDPEVFTKMLESVASQTYTNWELCIADASSTRRLYGLVQDFIAKHALDAKGANNSQDIRKKVKYKFLEKNRGISANLNEALSDATGNYVTFLDHDDVLTKNALFEVMKVLNRKSPLPKFIYSDEDKVSYDDSTYFDYHKKTDFDPAMLLTNNYICHLMVADTELVKELGGFESDFDGSQDFDLALRMYESVGEELIVHIPKVLYHWRSVKASTAENPDAKLYAYEAGKHAIEASLKRRGVSADVLGTKHLGFFSVKFLGVDGKIKKMRPEEMMALNEDAFNRISEDYICVVSDNLQYDEKALEALCGPLALDFAGAATGKIIRNNVLESAGYEIGKNGGVKPCFEGLNKHFSGYLHRASLLRCVDAFDDGCVLYKKDALEWKTDGPALKAEYKCVYVPEAEFKRI